MRARACIKCRQYVKIWPNNPLNQNFIRVFEINHKGHTLITLDLDEIKDQYQIIKNNGSNGSSEENHNS